MLDYLRLVDTAADELCEIVAAVSTGRPVGVLGHSLGAEIALVATARTQRIDVVVAIGTVVSDPAWTGPTSRWAGGNTDEFAEALARVTLLDQPDRLALRDVRYLHGVDDTDAPIEELLRLLDAVGHTGRLTMIPGDHELTGEAIDSTSGILAQQLPTVRGHASGQWLAN